MARYNAGTIPASPTVVSGVTAFGTHVNPFIEAALSGFSGTTRSDSATAGHIWAKEISGGYELNLFVGSATDVPLGTVTTSDDQYRLPIEVIEDALDDSGRGLRAGAGFIWFGNTAPDGTVFCDGAAYSRTTYANLFAVIGTTYGAGNGSTTFNVPDFRNRSPLGVGSRALGVTGGAETHTLTNTEMPSHNHDGATASTPIAGFFDIRARGSTEAITAASGVFNSLGRDAAHGTSSTLEGGAGDNAEQRIEINAAHTHVIPSDGGGNAHNNMHPFLTVNFVIKY